MKSSRSTEIRKALVSAFPHTIPVLTGFLVLGIAYGILMRTQGFATGWAVLMSAVAFCGSMQFVAITLLTTVFAPVQAFLLSLLVNARHIFYGISMLQKYSGLGKARGLLIYTLCDETFSLAAGAVPPEGVNRKYFYLSLSLLDYSYWVLGTFLGGVLGGFVSFDTKGLDFVLTALFAVLFTEQLRVRENRLPALIGVGATLAALVLFGAQNLVLPAMAIILVCLTAGRHKLC